MRRTHSAARYVNIRLARVILRARKQDGMAALRAENDRLRDRERLRDDIVATVSHELRTPLTSIRALGELMLASPDMDADQRDMFLRIVVAETERLTRLTEQVLDLTALEADDGGWGDADVDIGALIIDVVAGMTGVFAERGIAVATHQPPCPAIVRVDADRLRQVLVNLLSNAVKFVPESEGMIDIALTLTRQDVTVRVSDNGPGVPLEDRPHVFARFRQGGNAATRLPGKGLGLFISRRIIERAGGRMWLESPPDHGACFGFSLPLAAGTC